MMLSSLSSAVEPWIGSPLISVVYYFGFSLNPLQSLSSPLFLLLVLVPFSTTSIMPIYTYD